MTPEIKFKVTNSDGGITEHVFRQKTIKVGRLATAHLKLDDPTVSRIHAVIEVDDAGNITLGDMGSSSGTIVNGQKVTKHALKPGDQLVMGRTKVEFNMVAPAAKEDEPKRPETSGPKPAPRPAPRAVPTPAAPREVSGVRAAPKPAPRPAPKPAPRPAPRAPGKLGKRLGKRREPLKVQRDVVQDFVGEPLDEGMSATNRVMEIQVVWKGAVLGSFKYLKGEPVILGATPKCNLPFDAPGLPAAEFPVIQRAGTEFVLNFPGNLEGEVFIEGAAKSLVSLQEQGRATPATGLHACYSYNLPPNARVRLTFPNFELLMKFTSPPAQVPKGAFRYVDYSLVNAFLMSLFAVLTGITALFLFPYDAAETTEEILKNQNNFIQFILTPPKPPEKDPLLEKLKKTDQGDPGKKAAKDEGQMGKKEAIKQFTKSAVKAIDPKDREIVQKSGLLNMLNSGPAGGNNNPWGGIGLGGDLESALGGVVGNAIGDAYGMGGLGLRGGGPGGGGDGLNSIGLGGIGTRGRGSGEDGYGDGYGEGKKQAKGISINTGDALIMGSLDKELIRRVIRAHRNQIRYCYERELARTPGLFGKITVTFVISGDGGVQSAKIKDTSMNNSAVEQCLVQKVLTWKFPAPKGGGIVIVSYPFIFTQA